MELKAPSNNKWMPSSSSFVTVDNLLLLLNKKGFKIVWILGFVA